MADHQTKPVSWVYPLEEIQERRKKLRELLLYEHQGRIRTGPGFEKLVDHIRLILPKSIQREIIHDSVRHLAGERLTKEKLSEICWRLTGNQPRLSRRRAVPPWTRQPFLEWVPAQIIAARRERNRKNDLGYMFQFQVLAGLCCPWTIYKWWSLRTCHYLSRNFGFERPKSDRAKRAAVSVFHAPEEFVTLRLRLLIDPELCGEEPGFREVDFPPSLADWNREQHHHRARVEPGYECPKGYPQAQPCYLCPIGWKECRAATHRSTYLVGPCDTCSEPEAPFDPDDPADECVNCVRARVNREKRSE